MAKNKVKSTVQNASRRVDYDANTQVALASYFGAPSMVDEATVKEFEKDFNADNKYTRGTHFKEFISRNRRPITISAIVVAVVSVLLVIIF